MTIEQVKADIASGKCTRIYYSSKSLWWTHLDDDVTESTKIGEEVFERKHRHFMSNIKIPQSEKERRDALYKSIMESEYRPPLSVDGSTLFMFTDKKDVLRWISEAEKKPEHFGKHGLDAFMKAHHQNCGGNASDKWSNYNLLIDIEKDGFNSLFRGAEYKPVETLPQNTLTYKPSKNDFDDNGKVKRQLSKQIKQSRNSLCFCGSGKKYKRCCINKTQ